MKSFKVYVTETVMDETETLVYTVDAETADEAIDKGMDLALECGSSEAEYEYERIEEVEDCQ